MNKKAGLLFPLEAVEIALLVGFVLLGVIFISVASNRSISNTEKQASVQRDIYLSNEMLYILSATPVQTSRGDFLFSQIIDQYYKLELSNDLSDADKSYLDELKDKLIITSSKVFKSSRPYVDSEIYHKDYADKELKLYSDKYGVISYFPINMIPEAFVATVFTSKTYQSSLILPSSIDRGDNYYINISMYFYG